MAYINTKKTALYFKSGATLPVPPANFLETKEPVLIAPEFATEDVNRLNGKLNNKDIIVDTCRTKVSFAAVHAMRAASKVSGAFDTPPEYGELLKAGGFKEVVDTSTAGQETVTYNNDPDTVVGGSAVAFVDDNKFDMTDSLAVGITFDLTVGKQATVTGDLTGYIDSPVPAQSTNPAVSLSDEPALVVSCADIYTYDGTVIPTESIKITTNPDIQDVYTMGGANGIKNNFASDYSLQLEATFYVDKTRYGIDPTNIGTGEMKKIEVKIGLDHASAPINGKSVIFTADLSKTITYSDTSDKDMLKRTVTFRLMNNSASNDVALSIKHGFFA